MNLHGSNQYPTQSGQVPNFPIAWSQLNPDIQVQLADIKDEFLMRPLPTRPLPAGTVSFGPGVHAIHRIHHIFAVVLPTRCHNFCHEPFHVNLCTLIRQVHEFFSCCCDIIAHLVESSACVASRNAVRFEWLGHNLRDCSEQAGCH